MIPAYLAVRDDVADTVGDLVVSGRQKKPGDRTANERKAIQLFRFWNGLPTEFYGRVTHNTKVWRLYEVLVSPEDLVELDAITGVVVAGAWNRDGTQYGQTLVMVEQGEELVEQVTGTPVYPLHPKLANWLASGQKHLFAGCAPKRLT